MSKRKINLTIRSFREGDEEALARLFNSYTAGYFGPMRVTPAGWRSYYRQASWNAPSLTDDSDCGRIAESDGRIVGYAITDYQPMFFEDGAVLQELCVVEEEGAAETVAALVEDAEQRTLARGKSYLVFLASPDDGLATSAARARGYWNGDNSGVFMVYVADLAGALAELLPELKQRLAESKGCDWRGAIKISSGEQSCIIVVSSNGIELAGEERKPDITVRVHSEALPLLLFGREHVGELYIQDQLTLKAADVEEALRLLHVLFPRLPLYLPRAQSW